jgi:ABC-2 type transport system permease protein
MTFFVLVRKLLRDMRWSLGLPVLAFLALTVLTVWLATRFERTLAEPEPPTSERARRGLGIARGLGGPAQDFSTIGLEVFWWNHPFIVLTVVGWAIARGSAAVAGEIDRGTMDLTLSRPVSRTTYLSAQIAVSVFGLLMLAGALALGTYVAGKFFALKSPPSFLHLCRPATIVFALGLSIFGYTLPLSAVDSVRWRPGLIALGATLLGVIAMSLAPQFEGYDWLENFTVFKLYAPVTIAIKGEPLAYNATVLASVFLTGVIAAFGAFLWRDLPATGG